MTRQLAFDLPATEAFSAAAFHRSPANAAALAALADWQHWPGGKMLIVGPTGAGKTHLAHIWCTMTGAERVEGSALTGTDLPDLARFGAVCVENAHLVAGNPPLETALFHLHNLALPQGRLMLTATSAPRDWGLGLPDLLSRMQSAALTRLEAPDDALLAAVLAKLFSDRQITPPPNLIPYLLPRMFRSIASARDLVAALDARALAQNRPVTRALAAELLDPAATT